MDEIAQLSKEDRADVFRETAARMGGIHPLIPEKDYWVSWVLAELFAADAYPTFMFKGGTSLSMAYGAIDRFSEDVDLALDRFELGFEGGEDPLEANSYSQAKKLIKKLDGARAHCVNHLIRPRLATAVRDLLDDGSIKIVEDGHSIAFIYPASLSDDEYGGFSYVSPSVLLEIGARSDHDPVETHVVSSYATERFPEFAASPVNMRVLAAERTFWEKATILHVEGLRPKESRGSWARQSRHCYDIHELIRRGIAAKALERLDLLEAVSWHKTVFYRSAWADYAAATPGSLIVRPRGEYAEALARDYRAMEQMIFGEVPDWSEVTNALGAFEGRLNDAAGTVPAA